MSMLKRPAGARTAVAAAVLVVTAFWLAGCSADVSDVDRAAARVSAAENAVTEAESALAASIAAFCDESKDYVLALDRYGDVLNATAPTVGDVREAGADLADPREDAFDAAEAVVVAQDDLVSAQDDLASARAALSEAETGETAAPVDPVEPPPAASAAVTASVDRVEQAEAEFAAAEGAVTDQTPLSDAAEQFNSAAVALEMAWMRLFVDVGCVPEDRAADVQAGAAAYTAALQQDLADAGFYAGAVDGIYGPATVAAVEALQTASGLPVTGTVDKATAEALQAVLLAQGGAAAQAELATTAAVQQTLKLAGFWDGPIDGVWTPALTDAVMRFQIELGVEPTGVVDAATVAAFQTALAAAGSVDEPSPTPSP